MVMEADLAPAHLRLCRQDLPVCVDSHLVPPRGVEARGPQGVDRQSPQPVVRVRQRRRGLGDSRQRQRVRACDASLLRLHLCSLRLGLVFPRDRDVQVRVHVNGHSALLEPGKVAPQEDGWLEHDPQLEALREDHPEGRPEVRVEERGLHGGIEALQGVEAERRIEDAMRLATHGHGTMEGARMVHSRVELEPRLDGKRHAPKRHVHFLEPLWHTEALHQWKREDLRCEGVHLGGGSRVHLGEDPCLEVAVAMRAQRPLHLRRRGEPCKL
mmetsp:Transcript_122955/g.358882  ORF Transcript_122955/g.358882 Transcript_122955/m.358882 type:complete len:270 (+) Transcript_122955:2136-2945(+)